MKTFNEFVGTVVNFKEDTRKRMEDFLSFISSVDNVELEYCKDLLIKIKKEVSNKLSGV